MIMGTGNGFKFVYDLPGNIKNVDQMNSPDLRLLTMTKVSGMNCRDSPNCWDSTVPCTTAQKF